MYSTWHVNIYIYSSSCTVHGLLIFTFTPVHVQYSTWYVNIYIYSSSQGAGRIAGLVIGILFAVVVVGVCAYCCFKKRKSFQGKTLTSMYIFCISKFIYHPLGIFCFRMCETQ